MSNRIDQLFKNKLSEFNLPPSEEAWAKVQNGLSKKNKVVIYWRAAAVLVLVSLLVSTWYMLSLPVEISSQQISKTENKEIHDGSVIPEVDKKESNNTRTTASNKSKDIDRGKQISKTEKPNSTLKKEIVKEESAEQLVEQSVQMEGVANGQAIIVAEVRQEKPIVIEFTLPTIEENTPAEVSLVNSETEKSTGIMKFLETARDVKNGEAEFGNSLRDYKNELFALEFKKDKTKRN